MKIKMGCKKAHGERSHPAVLTIVCLLVGLIAGGCARLPYTTQVVHEDVRVAVKLQQEAKPANYTHPVQLTSQELSAILRGFSLREQKRLPLRWFAEELPPKKIFREDEVLVLAPYLADALQKAGTGERVYFELFDPGLNPRYDREVTAGWVAVREPFFHLTIEYFHTQQPTTKSSPYDFNYPTPPPEPRSYVLYFEPGRYWVLDQVSGNRAVDFRGFLKSGSVPGGG